MKTIWSFLFAISVVCSSLSAEIEGPDTAPPGDFVVLRIVDARENSSTLWLMISPEGTRFQTFESNQSCVFSTGCTPGVEYKALCVVADHENRTQEAVYHSVLVEGEAPPPPPPPPGPEIPKGEFDISPSVYKWAQTVDPPARKRALLIKENFEQIAQKIQDSEEGYVTVVDVVDKTAQANRKDLGEDYAVWKEKFFTPLQAALKSLAGKGKLKTLEDHMKCWREIALGLSFVTY